MISGAIRSCGFDSIVGEAGGVRGTRRQALLSTLFVVSLALAACQSEPSIPQNVDGGANRGTGTPAASVTGEAEATPEATPVSSAEVPENVKASDFDPSFFDEDSANIDNEWWPVQPGTKWVWEGRAIEDGERVERRVVFVVTDLTKEIAGVRTRIGWDNDYNDGVLGETELIFLAQDTAGNVWHLGQYREVYEDEFVGGRIWVVGDPEGAEAGILMKAKPKFGAPSYSQGFAPPPWDWDDRARVHRMGIRNCVPVGCFEDVLVTEEFEPSVPGAFQLKYYARGIGNIRVGWGGPLEEEREVMVLVKHIQLSPEGLAAARERALELEHRGYAYARTPAAEMDG